MELKFNLEKEEKINYKLSNNISLEFILDENNVINVNKIIGECEKQEINIEDEVKKVFEYYLEYSKNNKKNKNKPSSTEHENYQNYLTSFVNDTQIDVKNEKSENINPYKITKFENG